MDKSAKSEQSDKSAVQTMAEALAASCPSYLGHPTIPPISWAQNGEMITVILADGWKVSASIQAINTLMFKQGLNDLPSNFDNVEIPAQPPASPEPVPGSSRGKPVTKRKKK